MGLSKFEGESGGVFWVVGADSCRCPTVIDDWEKSGANVEGYFRHGPIELVSSGMEATGEFDGY